MDYQSDIKKNLAWRKSMNKQMPLPVRAHVELTNRCNFKCAICSHGYSDYGQDMDDEVYMRFVKEILPNLNEIEMQGTGEALLSSHFWEVFHAVDALEKCHINLITNGSIMNKEIAKKFVNANMQLTFSLDGASEYEFAKNRPVGQFDKIIDHIKLVSEARREAHNENFVLCVNMVLTRRNYKTLEGMAELSMDLGIDYLLISEVRKCNIPDSVWSSIRLDNYCEREKVLKLVENCRIETKRKNIGFSFNPYLEDKTIKKSLCMSPWKHIFIDSKGDVSVCCELNQVFGSLKNMSIKDIWNSQDLNDFRNDMIIGNYNGRCEECCLPWGITSE